MALDEAMISTVVYCTIMTVNKVLSEFFTNAAVALFTVGVLAPIFTKPFGLVETSFYFLASVGSVASLLAAGYFEERK